MDLEKRNSQLKESFTKVLAGGVVVEVTSLDQARIAEKAGAIAVEVSNSRKRNKTGVDDLTMLRSITSAVTIPIIAKCRAGNFTEAQYLQGVGVAMIDEADLPVPIDEKKYLDKNKFTVPFVCGARNLGEALRRITEGAIMIRTYSGISTSSVVETAKYLKDINLNIYSLKTLKRNEMTLSNISKEFQVPLKLVEQIIQFGRLPAPLFASGGISTLDDVDLVLGPGCDGVFISSDIFKSNASERAIREAACAVKQHFSKNGENK